MKRTLQVMVAAIFVVGLMAAPAQANIEFFANYSIGVLSGDAAELAFVETTTGDDLDIFAKKNKGQATEFFTDEVNMTISETTGTAWDVSWTTSNWDILWILVKDGAVDGSGTPPNQAYALWRVTPDQVNLGSGTVGLCATPGTCASPFDKGISHITVFGENVPEPATLLLLGAGLLGTAVLRRRLS